MKQETLYFKTSRETSIEDLEALSQNLTGKDFVFLPPGVELTVTAPLEHLVALVKQWGIDKGITGPQGEGTLIGQANKMAEESHETWEAVHNQFNSGGTFFLPQIKDGIGDTCVTLILLADMCGWTLEECLKHAYDEIKGRTGKMDNGTFIKD